MSKFIKVTMVDVGEIALNTDDILMICSVPDTNGNTLIQTKVAIYIPTVPQRGNILFVKESYGRITEMLRSVN